MKPVLTHVQLSAGVLILLFAVNYASAQGGLNSPDREDPPPVSQEASISVTEDAPLDSAIQDRILALYASVGGLNGVTVVVRNGIVKLNGTVNTRELQQDAEDLARRVEGVISISNNLELDRKLSSRLDASAEQLKTGFFGLVALLPGLLVAVLILFGSWLLARTIGAWDRLFARVTPNPFLAGLARQIIKTLIVVVGLLLALEILNASALLGSLAGALGLVGLAVGIATRDTVENYIASILLSVRQPFEPFDHIVVSDMEGIVQRLSSRATILMSLDGNHIRIPNSVIYKSTITNFTRNPRRRFEFRVGVDTELDLTLPRQIALRSLQVIPGILKDPSPACLVDKLGDSTVILKVQGWVDQRHADFNKVRSEALRLVKENFDDAGIGMPEPIYNVNLRRSHREKARSPSDAVGIGKDPGTNHSGDDSDIETTPDRTIRRQIELEASHSPGENLLTLDALDE